MILSSFVSMAVLLVGPPETEVAVELKNCTQAQAEALFGVKGGGCLIYDVTKKEAKTEIELCGGLMVGVAVKIGGGAELEHEKIACIKITTVFSSDNAGEVKQFLESKKPESKVVRQIMKDSMIRELRKQGVDESTLKKIRSIEFGEFKDATKREVQIRKILEKCPPASDFPRVS